MPLEDPGTFTIQLGQAKCMRAITTELSRYPHQEYVLDLTDATDELSRP